MRHKSFHEYIFLVSANDVMEHFAFPGNIDFADDDQGFEAYCSLRNEMERNEMERNEMERNEMKICSLRNGNL